MQQGTQVWQRQNLHSRQATKTQNKSGYVFLTAKLSVNPNTKRKTKHWRETRLITR